MTISSQDDAEAWSKAQWVANARNGFWAQSSAGGAFTKCISLTGSHISDVRTGAALLADYLLFANNQIDHFGDDGIDYAASNLAITRNHLHDNLGIDGNHEDAMQGVIGILPTVATVNHFQNILIDSNLIRQTDPELSFPTYLQGIDAFDSDWTNMTVTNNVIVTSACWGMDLASIHSGLVANNTVLDDGLVTTPGCTVALAVGAASHEGSNSSNTRVTNNLASQVWVFNGNTPSMPPPDHNVALGPQTRHQARKRPDFTDAHSSLTGPSMNRKSQCASLSTSGSARRLIPSRTKSVSLGLSPQLAAGGLSRRTATRAYREPRALAGRRSQKNRARSPW